MTTSDPYPTTNEDPALSEEPPTYPNQIPSPNEPDTGDTLPPLPTIDGPSGSMADHRGDLSMLMVWAIAAFALTFINAFIGAKVPLPAQDTIESHAIGAIYLLTLLFSLMKVAWYAARLPLSAPFLLIAGVAFAAPTGVSLLIRQQHVNAPFWLELVANNLFLPLGAAFVGAGVGRIIKHPNTVLAAAVASAFFDVVVVTMGTVAQVMKKNPNAIASVSVGAAPQVLGHLTKSIPILSGVTIGPADVLFLGLFFSCIFALKLSAQATFNWIWAFLATALVIVEFTYLPIPALAPMGIAVLCANGKYGAFSTEEKKAMVIGGIFAVVCAILMVFGARYLVNR